MGASEHTRAIFWGRAYGLDIREEREDDDTLRVYGSKPFADTYTLLARGPVAEIVGRFDVSGGMRHWLRRQAGTVLTTEARAPLDG